MDGLVDVWVYASMDVRKYGCMYANMAMYACMYVCMYVCNICIYVHVRMYKCMYICMYSDRNKQNISLYVDMTSVVSFFTFRDLQSFIFDIHIIRLTSPWCMVEICKSLTCPMEKVKLYSDYMHTHA